MSRLLALALAALPAAAADPPPELALVPADAAGVVHVRVADVWANPAMADYRALVQRAGDDAVASLDAQFVPPPSTLDRVTAFVLPLSEATSSPHVLIVARFGKPFDPAKVRAAYMPGAKPQAAGGKEFFADGPSKVAAYFPDAQTLVLSDAAGLKAYLGRKPAGGGKLAETLAAAGGKPLVVAVNLKATPIPPQWTAQVPVDFKPLLDAELFTATLSLDAEPALSARLVYATADEATAADVALRKGVKQLKPFLTRGREEMRRELAGGPRPAGTPRPLGELPQAVSGLVGLGALNQLEELLDSPPVKKVGTALAFEATLPRWSTGYVGLSAVGVGLALPAVQKVREAAARAQSQNNLKQIGLAVHNYESVNQHFPPAAFTSRKGGRGGLSWRVAVLPYIEEDELYKRFKLDEPWDSEHNRKLVPLMPKVYADPRGPSTEPGVTYYKAFVGGGAMFEWNTGRRLTEVHDGTSNTLMVGAFGPPVPWTKPDDFEYDPAKPLPDLFAPFGGLNALFGDGSVRFISPAVDPKMLRAFITASGGERVQQDNAP